MHAIAPDASGLKTLQKVAFTHTSAHQDSLYPMIVLSRVASRKQNALPSKNLVNHSVMDLCFKMCRAARRAPGAAPLHWLMAPQRRTSCVSMFLMESSWTSQSMWCTYPQVSHMPMQTPKMYLSRIGTAFERWSMAP